MHTWELGALEKEQEEIQQDVFLLVSVGVPDTSPELASLHKRYEWVVSRLSFLRKEYANGRN